MKKNALQRQFQKLSFKQLARASLKAKVRQEKVIKVNMILSPKVAALHSTFMVIVTVVSSSETIH